MRANLTQHRLVQSRQDKIHEPHNCNAQRVHLRPDFGWQDFCKNQPGHRTVPSLELKLNNRDFKDRKVHIILKIKFVSSLSVSDCGVSNLQGGLYVFIHQKCGICG